MSRAEFSDLVSADYGRDVTAMAERLFGIAEPALLSDPRGSGFVAFRHRDLSALAVRPDLGGPATDGIAEPSTVAILKNHIFTMNPPLHAPQRKLFAQHFSPKAVALLAEAAETAVGEILAETLGAGPIDFQSGFAVRLAARFWARLIGLTAEEESRFVEIFARDFSVTFMMNPSEEQSARLVEANERYLDTVPTAIMRSLDAGDNDILNTMAADLDAVDHGGRSATIGLLLGSTLVDGFHTLSVAITNVIYALVTRPDEWRRVQNEPALAHNAFVEGTRLEPPLLSTPRFALADVVYDGLVLREGTPVSLMWIIGNRDPDIFERPHDYDLDRKPGHARTFGGGARICPGRNVARLLGVATVKALTSPGVAVDLHGASHSWAAGTSLHELENFAVSVTPVVSR